MKCFQAFKIAHFIKIYTFKDTTSEDGDLNVLLKYPACEPQIVSFESALGFY